MTHYEKRLASKRSEKAYPPLTIPPFDGAGMAGTHNQSSHKLSYP